MNEHGATLIEVILTATIIALLASVATLGVNLYITEGKQRIVQSDLASLKAAVRLYILDKGFPATFTPQTDLVDDYLPELPIDPFSRDGSGYVMTLRQDPSDGQIKVYIGSRGPNGVAEAGGGDDIYVYVR